MSKLNSKPQNPLWQTTKPERKSYYTYFFGQNMIYNMIAAYLTTFLLLLGVCRQRGDEHMHVAPFHLRGTFDDGDVLQILGEALQDGQALLRVGHLATAEHDDDFYMIAIIEKALNLADFDI